eukprot:2439510-Karenia_brevis.AAC.1
MQTALHSWGSTNLVNFDPTKESKHILGRQRPVGGDFRILGCAFDCKLLMAGCIHETVLSVNWKMRSLLRMR